MNYSNINDLTKELLAATQELMVEEPAAIRDFRTGNLENHAGSYGQYFGTWDIAAGMIRDYSMYTWYPMVQLVEDESIGLDQFRKIVKAFDPPYSNYLRFSGFPEMGRRAVALADLLAKTNSRQDAIAAVRAFCAYTNKLAAWSYHYFPWGLGEQFRYQTAEVPVPVMPDPAGRVRLKNGRKIRLTWKPLGISVDAALAVNENPDLCLDLIAALPFTIVQDHAVVTGESIYAWTPIISTAPIHVRERICDAPVGRLRFSQSTGQKLIVQYGPTTEDLRQPVLGEVIEAHAPRLAEVGRRVWESTFKTKQLIWLTVELA